MPIYGEASNHRYHSWTFHMICFVVTSWVRTSVTAT